MKKPPNWTVLYNIVSDSPYIGEGWEFFDDEAKAQKCYDHQIAIGNCPTKRPFHKNDIEYMGIIDKNNMKKYYDQRNTP